MEHQTVISALLVLLVLQLSLKGNNAHPVSRNVVQNITKACQFDGDFPIDCTHVFKLGYTCSGVYKIKPAMSDRPFDVYCEMDFYRGWTVIMRRYDGSQNFALNWTDYKEGFGDLYGEHWLGNENTHILTLKNGPSHSRKYSLRVEFTNWNARKHFYAEYEMFLLGSEETNYTIRLVGFSGTATDKLGAHTGTPFSTRDRDSDKRSENCGAHFNAGFWYGYNNGEQCHNQVHLTGAYEILCGTGCMDWNDVALRTATMKITRYDSPV